MRSILRINTGGKVLVFEIMVAKTYDENREFDCEEFDLLRDGSDDERSV